MNQRYTALFAAIFLIIAIIGIIATVQTFLAILLALLPIGLFLENNKIKIANFYGPKLGPKTNYIRYIVLFAFGVGLVVYVVVSAISGIGLLSPPTFMILLTIGLFLSNYVFKEVQ